MKEEVLEIKGMTCENCVKHVKEALVGVDGVVSAEVSLPGEAKVAFDEVKTNKKAMAAAVKEAGYKVKGSGIFG